MRDRILLIRGGRLLAPGEDLHGDVGDVLLVNGKIAGIASAIPAPPQADIISLEGQYVSPGFIDGHGHFDMENPMGIGLYHDAAGVRVGNSTVIDAGTTGAENFPHFRKRYMDQGMTRLYAMLNLSCRGIDTWAEESDVSRFDLKAIRQVVAGNRDRIVAIKVRSDWEAVGRLGIYPCQMGQRIARELDLPLVIHIGEAEPFSTDILDLTDKGDMVTHCYNAYHPNGVWNSLIDDCGQIQREAWRARERGVLFDVGHGTCSFSFPVARAMIEQEFFPNTISTDIYTWNFVDPVGGLYRVMSKLLHLGMPLEDCVRAVTATPADFFRLSGIGHLKEGMEGDLTVFRLLRTPMEMTDSNGRTELCETLLLPEYVTVAGKAHRLC